MIRHLALILLAAPLLISGAARAADTSEPQRPEVQRPEPPRAIPQRAEAPRIGLVLGGGGARGFAHVGVLQVLEENRIPVHAIAGTSMGAVVGSLYAQGKSAAELKTITDEIPWTTVFNDAIPRDRLSFRRKRDERDVLIDFRISFDDKGLVLPKGVLRGQDLFLTLAEYLAPARGTEDFDRLAIPFRAVATDIETGTAVVMGTGDIATAVFASMAVPGGLPPVERDGKLLVDGFVSDNVPIDVTRGLGVNRLIVVDVGTPLRTRDRLTSFVSVLDQMQLLLGRDSVDRQIASLSDADVLIRPDQPDIGSTSFERAADGIAAGRLAALAVLPQLQAYSLSEADWKAHLAARDARAPRYAPTIEFVKIDNRSDIPDAQIEKLVSAQPGKPLDARQMTKDLQEVYALGGFRSVRYGVGPGQAGQGLPGEGVTIVADGDPTLANWLQFGLGIATDFNRNSVLRIGFAYTDRNFFGTGAEWRTDIRVGTNLLFETGLYKESGKFFTEVTPYWSRIDTILYVDGEALAEVRDARLGMRFDVGTLFGNWGEFRIGTNWAAVDLDTTIGSPLIGDLDSLQDATLRAQFSADTLDDISFPTKGVFSRIGFTQHVKVLGGDLDYGAFDAELWKAVSWGRNTLLLSTEIGITSDGDGRSLGDFRLGGFLNLSGLEPDQLIGRHKLLGRALFYHRTSDVAPIVNLPLYIGGSLEVGNTWTALDDMSFGSLRPAGSLFVGADTPLGPFIIAGGLTRGNGALYLILGRIF
jgi:NTE family protein